VSELRVAWFAESHKETFMSDESAVAVNRLERRKQRTRAALIKAAQTFIAAGKLNVPVLEITQAADVGMGSFYNHFDSKDELFKAAVADVLDAHGALLDQLTAPITDPAETFACNFRLTGRLFRRRPQETQILLANSLTLINSERGLAPRALRDINAAVRAGPIRHRRRRARTRGRRWGLDGHGDPHSQSARPRRRPDRGQGHRGPSADVRHVSETSP
jgi:AcrR family transcriptional regulator